MPSIFRRLTKRFFIILTIVITGLFLLSCSAWYLEPYTWWYIALLGVGFAFHLFSIFAILFFWIGFRSKWALVPLAAILIGWKQINAFFAFHPTKSWHQEKAQGAIRIMQWNVSRFDEMAKGGKSKRRQILAYIGQQNPDIICMQEFLESNNLKKMEVNIPFFRDSLGYKYFSYAMDHRRRDSVYEHGVAIFSKYPIKQTERRRFGGPKKMKADESYIYADISFQGKMIRVYTTHLQSLLFTRDELRSVEEIKHGDDSTIEKTKNIFNKFRQAYRFRQQQAEVVARQLNHSPYPEIICGDFNDVPNSFVYNSIRGERKDAFLGGGFGIGRTYSYVSATLRIDYILADRRFKVLQCQNPHPDLSDHYPVIVDFQFGIE